MVSAAVCCEAEVLLLLIHCLFCFHSLGREVCWAFVLLCDILFPFYLAEDVWGLIAVVFFQSYWCCNYSLLPHSAMCQSTVCVIMAFADHNHFLLSYIFENSGYVTTRSQSEI